MQQAAVAGRHRRQLLRDVGHVQRAGDAVEHRHADQEQQRSDQVDGDVVQPGTHPLAAPAVQQQAVAGRQQHLEEDEQVEQVGRQEGAVQPHQLQLEQHVEVHARVLPARQGVEQRGQADAAGQHRHQRRQPVGHQHDAEGHRPVARQVDAEGRRRLAPGHAQQQADRDRQPERRRQHVDHRLQAAPALAQQQHQRRRGQRQQHGGHQQVFGQRAQRAHHGCSSCPSTWSPPDRPRSASSTTRNSAVVAKPMTMAVSTSDCGSGSV